MSPTALFVGLPAVMIATGVLWPLIGLYIDHRARACARLQEPPGRPPSVFRWGALNLLYVFSPEFDRRQDATTRWLIWPLRLCAITSFLFAAAMLIFLAVMLNRYLATAF